MYKDLHIWYQHPPSSPHTSPTWTHHPHFCAAKLCAYHFFAWEGFSGSARLEKPNHPSRTSSKVTSSMKAPLREEGTVVYTLSYSPTHAY